MAIPVTGVELSWNSRITFFDGSKRPDGTFFAPTGTHFSFDQPN